MPWVRYQSGDLSVWGWLGTEVEVLGFSLIGPSEVHVPAEATWVATVNVHFFLSFFLSPRVTFLLEWVFPGF